MAYDLEDTIAAIATAPGGAARGMVRLSGPCVVECLATCFSPSEPKANLAEVRQALVTSGEFRLTHSELALPCKLFLWPTQRSYTRQPTAELHTVGAPPLLEAVLQTVCTCGARLAEPGEFTLRAFLAGRLDLTQAEAVLGVIDARGQQDLENALQQLAGGLSLPLMKLRELLLGILAELEAGLDFVEEDIEFISREQLGCQLAEAQQEVIGLLVQMGSRSGASLLPRVVLVGPPNAGKSSLFNALIELSSSNSSSPPAIVSAQSGTTRDYLTAVVELGGTLCELVDTAGEEELVAEETILQAAQEMTGSQRRRADLLVRCSESSPVSLGGKDELCVQTKVDLLDCALNSAEQGLACSSVTQAGLQQLQQEIGRRLTESASAAGSVVGSTAARSHESLRSAGAALTRAAELVDSLGGEELIALEIRAGLQEVGQVVGTVYTDDILDRIFQQFCIGK